MTKDEALTMLASAPRSNKVSRLNPGVTVSQAIDIVAEGIKSLPDGELRELMVKRVYQVSRNQKRPNI
jgi:hypothetical protein